MDASSLPSTGGCGGSKYGPLEKLKFRLGLSTVSAVGHQNDHEHPNVWRLSVVRSPFQRAVLSLLLWLPLSIQALLKPTIPGYFLPPRIVLKMLKPRWDDELDNEVRMYHHLQALQGTTIPRCYGEARCNGTRALVLSEVDGVLPFEQKPTPIDIDEFRRRLEAIFSELAVFGVVHDDPKPDNYLLLDDRIVMLVLESLGKYEPDKIKFFGWAGIEHLTERYEGYLRSREYELTGVYPPPIRRKPPPSWVPVPPRWEPQPDGFYPESSESESETDWNTIEPSATDGRCVIL